MNSIKAKLHTLFYITLLLLSTQTFGFTFTHVEHNGSQVEPGESVKVSFTTDTAAEVALEIFDGRDYLIATIHSHTTLTAGRHALQWNLMDFKNRPVYPGAYHYRLRATIGKKQWIYDMSNVTGGQLLAVKQVRYNPQTAAIEYSLPSMARVNIRVGFKDGGPLLGTVRDWVARSKGQQAEAWDGYDNSRQLQFSDHPLLDIQIKAFSLSENTIIVGRPLKTQWLASDNHLKRERKKPRKKMRHYAYQNPLDRHDVTLELNPVGNFKTHESGLPIVSKNVSFRLDVAEADRSYILASRFEPMFFVDGMFELEVELGYLPMTWQWDASTTTPGMHYITANVLGYEGHIGAATVAVWVEKPTKQEDK